MDMTKSHQRTGRAAVGGGNPKARGEVASIVSRTIPSADGLETGQHLRLRRGG